MFKINDGKLWCMVGYKKRHPDFIKPNGEFYEVETWEPFRQFVNRNLLILIELLMLYCLYVWILWRIIYV